MEATVIQRQAPQPLLSVTSHIAIAIGALALIAGGVAFAGHASEEAVQTAQAAISPGMTFVSLPRVEVVAHRADAVACVPPSANL